ncbi:MAG: homoserine dehydrogenase [Chloroflexaceae bacterium]|nr:homoserine dehydrogenase [Chloroflexaceae bacterium]
MTQEIGIIQIGTGGVGGELVRQVMAQQTALEQRYGFRLGYLALVERSGIISTGQMLDQETVSAALTAMKTRQDFAALRGGHPPGDWKQFLPATPCIVADITAADGMGPHLAQAVEMGHRVVLANKRPLTSGLDLFATLTANRATRYEVTVGAGLPIIDPLQRLLDSGDSLIRIEAAMSGTLGYLCGAIEEGTPLSEAVCTARSKGWTEPDPRDDLSGADVARKALILARTCGLPWTMDDIPCEPWFPPELAEISVEAFMQRVGSLDDPYAQRVTAARSRKTVLRYVASVEPEGASVGLRELPPDHPLAGLRGPDNMFVFTTARYSDPVPRLVVRGPGAGIEVTAAGAFGDIVATAREMLQP